MTNFIPTPDDLYPGQPTDEALTWAINFCKRNAEHLIKQGYRTSALMVYAYEYYRAVLLAKNRYNKLMAFLNDEVEPATEKPFLKHAFYQIVIEMNRKKKDELRNNRH